MFQEKYLIFQRGFPGGWLQGAAKPASKPEAQKPSEIDSQATEAQRRAAAEKFAASRREAMETVPQIADHILEDIFGHNADLVKQELGPKYERIIKNMERDLNPGEKYLKSVLKVDGVHIVFEQPNGRSLDMDPATVLLLSDEEVRSFWPLVTLKREDVKREAAEAKPESFEAKADKVIMGEIMDLMFVFKPDHIPDTIEIEDIYKTPFMQAIRQLLIQSYRQGKPYDVTTTDQGFKLESQDPKNFPEREFHVEQAWEEFWSEYAAAENAKASESEAANTDVDHWQDSVMGRSSEFDDVVKELDPTAQLDEDWKGRKAEDMTLEDVETLIFGDAERGIQGRTIAEIEAIYGEIPNLAEMPIRDALFTRANKKYFSDLDIKSTDKVVLFNNMKVLAARCPALDAAYQPVKTLLESNKGRLSEEEIAAHNLFINNLDFLEENADIKTAAAVKLFGRFHDEFIGE